MTTPSLPGLTRRRLAQTVGAAVLATGVARSTVPVRAQDSGPVRVVATFSILADWVQQVGGKNIDLTTIVPAGGDAHTFDPSPDQVASIAEADVIFEIGLGFETWLDDMVGASGSTAERVVVSDGIAQLEGAGHEEQEAHEDEEDAHEEDGEAHGETDPHIWGDVANAVIAVEIIRTRFGQIDPANAAGYDANTAAYSSDLDVLDASIRESTGAIPEDERRLVTTHDTFGYYAQAYGFTVVGTALGSLSTEGGDPPASEIAALVEAIQAEGVPAIFAENIANDDLMQTIADEADVTLAPPLYTDALGEPGSDGDTYVAMMTANTDTIVAALGGD